MVKRVNSVPPPISVRKTMPPIVGKVECHEVQSEHDHWPRMEKLEPCRTKERSQLTDLHESSQMAVQPVILKEGDEREQNNTDNEGIPHVGCDWITLLPLGERPEMLYRSAYRNTDAQFGHTADGPKQPQGNWTTVVLNAVLGETRLKGVDRALNMDRKPVSDTRYRSHSPSCHLHYQDRSRPRTSASGSQGSVRSLQRRAGLARSTLTKDSPGTQNPHWRYVRRECWRSEGFPSMSRRIARISPAVDFE